MGRTEDTGMLTFQNVTQIAGLIKASHGEQVADEPMFGDFCRIGSLLTDEGPCLAHLEQLNQALVTRAEQRGVLKAMTQRTLLAPPKLKSVGEAVTDDGDKVPIHKHHKVLTSFFDEFEAQNGFNTGRLPIDLQTDEMPVLPERAPKLIAFVSPAYFRKYLFQYAYHWKDAGVGWNHGEFTHRIHWYLVLRHLQTNGDWLTHKPLDCSVPVPCRSGATPITRARGSGTTCSMTCPRRTRSAARRPCTGS
jgi:hypothetical protein